MFSVEQSKELIHLIQTEQQGDSKASVRRAPRLEDPRKIMIALVRPDQEACEYEVQLRDISARGLSFFHTQKLDDGIKFSFALAAGESESVTIICEVIHTREVNKGLFQIGAKFTRILDPQRNLVVVPEDLDISMQF